MKQLNWHQIFGKSNIPDGRTVLPTDDIQIWLHCANIWDKSYTTLAEVLADTDTLTALINSNNAVDYMVRSTTWASGVSADSSAMTYIGQNNYCANTLLADATWCNAICNSEYFESVLNVKVPVMTSNTTPEGELTGLAHQNYPLYYAFDNNANTKWVIIDANGVYIQYQFPRSTRIYFMTWVGNIDSPYLPPTQMVAKGSSDGMTYDTLKTVTSVPADTNEHSAIFDSANSYNYYKVECANRAYSGHNYVQLSALQFYGREDV